MKKIPQKEKKKFQLRKIVLFPFSNIKRDNSCNRHKSIKYLPVKLYCLFFGGGLVVSLWVLCFFMLTGYYLCTYLYMYIEVLSLVQIMMHQINIVYSMHQQFQCLTLSLLFICCMIVKRIQTVDILQIFWYRQGDLEPKFRRMIIYNAFTIILLCVCGNLYFHNILRKKTS